MPVQVTTLWKVVDGYKTYIASACIVLTGLLFAAEAIDEPAAIAIIAPLLGLTHIFQRMATSKSAEEVAGNVTKAIIGWQRLKTELHKQGPTHDEVAIDDVVSVPKGGTYYSGPVGLLLCVLMPGCGQTPAPPIGNAGTLVLRAQVDQLVEQSATDEELRVLLCRMLKCDEGGSDDGSPVKVVRLPFYRHSSVGLTNAEADRICQEMTTLVSSKDYADDVATPVKFVREGDVRVLPGNLARVVQTSAQLNALFGLPGVKRVAGINYCGGAGSNIIGCAPLNSPVINVLWAFDQASLIPITVAHEIGHNNGCGHLAGDQRNLMYPSVGPNRLLLTAQQSRQFLQGPQAMVGAVEHAPAMDECPDCDLQRLDDRLSILQVVRQHYVEGSHALDGQLKAFTAADGAELLKQMHRADPQDDQYLANFVHAIATLGTPNAMPTLESILHDQRSTPSAWRAKHAVLHGLGRMIDRNGEPRAVDTLAAVASQPQAAAACVPDQPLALLSDPDVIPPSEDELAAELALGAKIALESAKHPAARARVEILRQQTFYAALGN
jgi:hypothetical protein